MGWPSMFYVFNEEAIWKFESCGLDPDVNGTSVEKTVRGGSVKSPDIDHESSKWVKKTGWP